MGLIHPNTEARRRYMTAKEEREKSRVERAMKAQRAEFDAVAELAKQYRRIELTAPVDDDYPSVRWDYDNAVFEVLKAFRANGRKSK